MKVYIAGKVTGLPLIEAQQKFVKTAMVIHDLGHEVLNPCALVLDRWTLNDINSGVVGWAEIMKYLIGEHLCRADMVVMLPCWPQSRGAVLERYLAGCLGIQIIEEAELIRAIHLKLGAK